MALSCVEFGTRKVSVIVCAVTPCAVAPRLSPLNAGMQLGECPVHVNCRTPASHLTPVFVTPDAAAGAEPGADAPPVGAVPGFTAPDRLPDDAVATAAAAPVAPVGLSAPGWAG